MKEEYAYWFFAMLALLGSGLFLMTQVRYRIGSKALKIQLFGLVIRKIPLEDIEHVSKRHPRGWTENWRNTFRTAHRMLTIERRAGLCKYVLITPRNRYVFMSELQNAVKRGRPDRDIVSDKS